MISNNAISINPYPATYAKVTIRDPQEKGSADAVIDQDKILRVDSPSANIEAVGGGSSVKALKKQIAEMQKILAEQQAQLASLQRSQVSPEQKAQQVMEMQTQIAVTASNLQVLQATLLQAMMSVDTHA